MILMLNNKNIYFQNTKGHLLVLFKIQQTYQMSFRNHGGCRCQTGSPNHFGRKAPSFAPSRVSDNPAHNYAEMEDILMQERNKFREIKERYELELDNEKKIRLTLENKLVKLKEEFVRKDVLISDLEFKENGCLNDNQSLAIENQKLRNELMFVEDSLREKILDLEAKLACETKNGEEAAIRYDLEFEKFKKEGLEYIQNLTQEYERKIKNLDEKGKAADGTKRGLGAEVKRLNDLILSNQLNHDTQHRETINRLRDEETRKVQQITKSFEQRLRALEEGKEAVSRKLQQANKMMQQKESDYDDLMNQKYQQIHKLNEENLNLTNQRNQIKSVYDKFKFDADERDKTSRIYGAEAAGSSEATYFKQQLENKKREVDTLKDLIRELKQNVKDAENNQGQDRQEWVDKSAFYEAETKKYRDLYERLCEKLKLRINETINTACYTKR